jgi:putative ABC transport system permease protein
MNLFETIRTAFESLTSNLLRTLLTMLGVIIGVASVVTLMSLGSGVQGYITGQLQSTGTNLLAISPDASNSDTPNARLTNDDVRAISNSLNVPQVKNVTAQVGGNLNVSAGTHSGSRSIVGTTPVNFPMRDINIGQGALYTEDDETTRSRVAVLGYQAARDLFPNQPALQQTILIGGVPFKVVGVTERQGGLGFGTSPDDTVYVPLSVAQEKLFANRSGGLKSVSTIIAETNSSDDSKAAVTAITSLLRRQHGLLAGQSDDFRVLDQASLISTLNTVTGTLTTFLSAIGAISLVVGGIGIMNIMLVSVTERTREIGLRKAIGAEPGAIRTQFLIEALLVTVFAGILGILLAIVASWGIGQLLGTFKPIVEAGSIAIAFGVSVLTGVVFGLYPAWRASRLSPVEALRAE